MHTRWGLATALGTLVATACPGPAYAATATLEDGVLTVSAGVDDKHLDVRVLEFGSDAFLPVTEVDIEPVTAVAGSECGREDGTWYCSGYPATIRLDGGPGTADLEVITHGNVHTSVQLIGGGAGTEALVTGTTGGPTQVRGGRSADHLTSYRSGTLRADLLGGDDAVEVPNSDIRSRIRLGSGDDALRAGSAIDLEGPLPGRVWARGQSGDDTFTTGFVRVMLDGGAGDDWFLPDTDPEAGVPGWGATAIPTPRDVLRGGAGRDAFELFRTGRHAPLLITLDGLANDGERGEGDNYLSDIEDVLVHFVSARVVGSPAGNHLALFAGGVARGRGGDDVLEGGTRMFAGSGFDVVIAGDDTVLVDVRDGEADVVRCSSAGTRVRADAQDSITGPCRVEAKLP